MPVPKWVKVALGIIGEWLLLVGAIATLIIAVDLCSPPKVSAPIPVDSYLRDEMRGRAELLRINNACETELFICKDNLALCQEACK